MSQTRDLKTDLFAIALCGAVVFLALSLCTYDPADPVGELIRPFNHWYQSDVLVYPLADEVSNACGRWGALAADMLFTSLGLAAFYFILSLAILDVLLLRRREVDAPIVRSLGWFASAVGLTTVMAILLSDVSPGPMIGAGGYLGALGKAILLEYFATAGGLILAVSLICGGLLLATDYAVVGVARRTVLIVLGSSLRLGRWLIARKPVVEAKQDELAEEYEEEEEELWEEEAEEYEEEEEEQEVEEEMPILVSGKKLGADDELEQEEPVVVAGESEPAETSKKRSKKSRRAARKPHFAVLRKPKKTERQEVIESLEEASRSPSQADYELPENEVLLPSDHCHLQEQAEEVRQKAKLLEKTFSNFGFRVKVVEVETGPVIAQYEVELEAGLRLSRISGLSDDLAIALRVPSVRIVAPIPGKNTVGIEVPNETQQVVRLREVIEETDSRKEKMQIPIFLGKDVSGSPLAFDLTTMPHLLIAGRTGTGKSVCLNSIICSILMTRRPDEVRMLMIDPKMVELSGYGQLPHLMHPVVTQMKKAEAILAWAVDKMEERYTLLARAGVRHVSRYNQLTEEQLMDRMEPETEQERQEIPRRLPFIVIIADEIADLMMTAGKEVEHHIIRLAQKSRAVGIHLILATQKPTVDVITGLIKSNLPARISFQVASRTDSRVVLDEIGAEKLLGNGDMLFLWPGTSTLLRGQGTYLSDDEINAVVDSASTGEQNFVNELVNLKVQVADGTGKGSSRKTDALFDSAVDIVIREGRGSVSLLQRNLGIGYGRAARLIDYMAEDGIVGEYAGSQAREVLMTMEQWERIQAGEEDLLEETGAPLDSDWGPSPAGSDVVDAGRLPGSVGAMSLPAESGVAVLTNEGLESSNESAVDFEYVEGELDEEQCEQDEAEYEEELLGDEEALEDVEDELAEDEEYEDVEDELAEDEEYEEEEEDEEEEEEEYELAEGESYEEEEEEDEEEDEEEEEEADEEEDEEVAEAEDEEYEEEEGAADEEYEEEDDEEYEQEEEADDEEYEEEEAADAEG